MTGVQTCALPICESKRIKYLRPDAKSQVTIEYADNGKPIRIDSIVVSTQHDDFGPDAEMLATIRKDIISYVIPRVKAQVKPSLKKLFNDQITFHINPTGKFVIGGPHGDTGLTGRKIIVDTYGTAKAKGANGKKMSDGEIAKIVDATFDMRPYWIEKRLKLRNPIYSETAAYGHMGREPQIITKTFNTPDGKTIEREVELFTWEKLDYVDKVKKAFKIK